MSNGNEEEKNKEADSASKKYPAGLHPNSMANLKPWTKENPSPNPGRKGTSITEHLRNIAASKSLEYNMTITNQNGKVIKKSGKIESHNDMGHLLATMAFQDAVGGNDKARKEIMDRLEGKATQFVNVTGEVASTVTQYDLTKVSDQALKELLSAQISGSNSNEESQEETFDPNDDLY